MPSVSAVAFTVVLLFVSAVPLCAAKCAFTVQVGLAIDSKLSMKIANVSLLKDCLLFLERHADTYAAVAYNEVSLDCCTVPAKESYKLVESAGWSTYYIEKQQQPPQSNEGSVVLTQSGNWTVPASVSVLKVLAVGGGGAGSCLNGGGGGSGFVNYLTLTVEPFQTFTITVGEGGHDSSDGRPTVFGNNLLTAAGGYSLCSCSGASGGSGGGAACAYENLTGSGGSGGSSGTSGASSEAGGAGQGSSFTSHFSQFKLNTLSAGAGAVGIAGNSTFHPGGGGGGGVLINGAGPNAAAGACIIDGVMCQPLPASGYGAGGSGGSNIRDENEVWINYWGGAGASGLIYIEYY